MERQQTPQFFYTLSPDFNYRKYLEERSHLDRVVISIDDQTAAIVGTGQRLGQRITGAAQVISGQIEISGKAIEGRLSELDESLISIDRTLFQGFETVSIELRGISAQVDMLEDALISGFNGLLNESRRTNELLSQLLQKVETPDQVWAEEKFISARSCVDRKLWQEALEFSNKAIGGDDRNSGYSLEPSFYYLRGRILEGLIGTDLQLVDVEAAKRDFILAHRYANESEHFFRKMALTRAGWCCYCMDNLQEAEGLLRSAVKIKAPVPEAEFLLAKILIRSGSTFESRAPLLKAMSEDSIFCFRVGADGDFLPHISQVRKWLLEYKHKIQEELKAWRENELQPDTISKLLDICREQNIESGKLASYYKDISNIDFNTYLSDLLDLQRGKNQFIDARNKLIFEQRDLIEEEVDRLTSGNPKTHVPPIQIEKNKDIVDSYTGIGTRLGVLTGGIFALSAIADEASRDKELGGIFSWFFGLIIYGIPGLVVGGLIGMFFGWAVGRAVNMSHEEKEQGKQERQRRDAQLELDKEVADLAKQKRKGFSLRQSSDQLFRELQR